MLSLVRMCKERLKRLIASIWAVFSFDVSSRVAIPILCYHSVGESLNYEGDSLPIADFERHLQYLKKNHTVISLREAVGILKGETDDIVNPVVLTFDDGYKDNYENAFPLLKKYDIPTTIFVVTGFINKNFTLIDDNDFDPLTWEQIREMDSYDFINFGAHTDTHRILSQIDNSEIYDEISISKSILMRELGHEIDLFAYPNGQFADIPDIARAAVEKNEFLCACSTFWKTTHRIDEKYAMNRVMISASDTLDVLKHKVKGHYDFIYYLQRSKFLLKKLLF